MSNWVILAGLAAAVLGILAGVLTADRFKAKIVAWLIIRRSRSRRNYAARDFVPPPRKDQRDHDGAGS